VPSKSFPVKEVRIESITPLCRIVLSFSISLTANELWVIGCPAKFILLGPVGRGSELFSIFFSFDWIKWMVVLDDSR
jgi:hypothetical protein